VIPPGGSRMSPETLLSRVSSELGSTPTAITVASDPQRPVVLEFGKQRIVYVDPYGGIVLGEGSQSVRSFFRAVTEQHRWLGLGAARHDTGRTITGAGNLLFLGLLCTGLVLWLPRRWAWPVLRNSVLIQRGPTGRTRFWNWHNVVGVWCVLPLLVITLSGVVMSYRWANDAVYVLTGNPPPPATQQQRPGLHEPDSVDKSPGGGDHEHATDRQEAYVGPNILLQNVEGKVKNWKLVTLQLASASPTTSATVHTGPEGRPDKRIQLTIDRATGAVMKSESFATYNAGRRLRAWLRFAHTGEAAGITGEAIAAAASLGAATLVLTGITLAVRRLLRARARRRPFAVEQIAETEVA
jgi:uncharacterized iron-regulated membrane protein